MGNVTRAVQNLINLFPVVEEVIYTLQILTAFCLSEIILFLKIVQIHFLVPNLQPK